MLRIRKEQFDVFEKIHEDKFYSDLEKYLVEEFPETGVAERNYLMVACRDACESMKIRNMNGIFAFYVLSFIHGSPVDCLAEYQITHRRYTLLGYNTEQLPTDILETMYR